MRNGDIEKAEALCLDLIKSDAFNPGYIINIAIIDIIRGNYESAADHCEMLIDTGHGSPEVTLNLAEAYLLMGDPRAEETYRRFLDQTEGSQETLMLAYRALSMACIGNKEEAREIIEQLNLEDEEEQGTYYIVSVAWSHIGDEAMTAEYAAKAARAGMGDHWFELPWFGAEVAAYNKGISDMNAEARESAAAIKDLDGVPAPAREHCTEAHTQLVRGDVEGGVGSLRTAILVLAKQHAGLIRNGTIIFALLLCIIVHDRIKVRRLSTALAAERSKNELERQERHAASAEKLQRLAQLEQSHDVMQLDVSQITDIADGIRRASGFVSYCARNLLEERHREQVIDRVNRGIERTEQELEHLLEIARELDELIQPIARPE
jgi:tetratricopeptide (TPR) repeat protein